MQTQAKRPQSSANDLIFGLLLLLVCVAPLPLGANRPWAWSLLSLLAGALCLSWGTMLALSRVRCGLSPRQIWPIAIPFLAALAWAILQTQSFMPAFFWAPIWTEAVATLGNSVTGSISVDADLTWAAIMRLAAYGAIFLLAAQLGRNRDRAARGMRILAGCIAVYAFYGWLIHVLGVERILWLEKWAYLGDATGTFVNRNAFGAFSAVGVILCLAMAVKPSSRRGTRPSRADRIERVMVQGLPWTMAAGMCFVALLYSHSRGALLSLGIGLAVWLVCLLVARIVSLRRGALLAVVALAAGGVLLLLLGEVTIGRLVTGESDLTGDRPNLMRLTLTAIEDAPLTGHGLGTFDLAFRPYRDLNLPRPVSYDFAHSFWLETIMELGIPAALSLFASAALIFLICARGLVARRRDQIYPATAMAAATVLGAHGVVDFSIQMPAMAVLLATLLGLGYAQSWPTDKGQAAAKAN